MIGDNWFDVNFTGDWSVDIEILRFLEGVRHGMADVGGDPGHGEPHPGHEREL